MAKFIFEIHKLKYKHLAYHKKKIFQKYEYTNIKKFGNIGVKF